MQRKWYFIGICGLSIGIMALSILLIMANTQLAEIEIRLNNAMEFPTAISQPRVRVDITYSKKGSKTRNISTYDDFIDLGNENLNRELTFAILIKREHELICPQVPITIEIDEEDGKAHVRIHWMQSLQMFSVRLDR